MPNPNPGLNPNPNPNPGRDGGSSRKADPRTVAALTAALKDTDKEVRETAMHALVQMRDPAIFEPLVEALRDASADVREQAAFGLGQLRDRRAVDPLIASLKDSNGDVREQAVFALGQLRDPRAVDGLVAGAQGHRRRRARAGGVLARADPGQARDARARPRRSPTRATTCANRPCSRSGSCAMPRRWMVSSPRCKDSQPKRARAGGVLARPDPRSQGDGCARRGAEGLRPQTSGSRRRSRSASSAIRRRSKHW